MTAASEAIWEYRPIRGFVRWIKSNSGVPEAQPQSGSSPDLWANRIHPEDRERIHLGFSAALEGQALSWSDEYRFRGANGEFAHVHDRAEIVRDSSGNVTRVVG